ncbi:MAG: thioredoxin domain-containing protein, partial [Anaerolineae bacterium]|nr:thioredoxin domain-containing protein [Anaerolineae bacterium]
PEGEWDTFRPTVDAFIANMEHVDASQSSVIPDPNHPIRARAYWLPGDQRSTLRQEDDPETPFHWEEFGITFTIPDDWRASIGGTDYDLALLSPETMAGEIGAYITFRYFASLGPDTTLEAALEPIAEQFESDVQPYNRSGLEGAEVVSQDDETGTVYHLILVPYDTHGAALYIQTVAPADEDIAVLAILDSMIINPVKPDVSALDAAWQQSLADDGAFIYGDDDAPVHMLEFLDFSCGHCANYSAAVDRLVALEVEQGRLQLELRLHSGVGGELSYQATMATYCAAEQGKGYTAYKTLFRGDMQQGRDFAYSREGIDELLGQPEIGLDMDALNACIDNDKYANAIQLNWAYANSVGANFTPAVLLATGDDEPAFLTLPDGEIWSGGVPLQVLRIVIDGVISDHKSIPEILDEVFGTSTESTESTDTGATTIEEEGAETAEPDESGDEAVQPEATEAAEDVEAPEAAETPAPTEEAVAQPEATEDAAAASEDATSGEGGEDDDGGLSAGVIVAVAAGIAVAIGAAIASQRKRTAAPDDNSSKSKDA